LPVWRRFLSDPVFLCIFRDPARTANSMVKECRTAAYLEGFSLDYAGAIEVWTLMYRHVLEIHRRAGEWHYFHYDQLFGAASLARLEAALGVRVDRGHANPQLNRSPATGYPGQTALRLYDSLCELAR
jgi:hypothetical protein